MSIEDFETLTLSDGPLEAEFAPSLGMAAVSLRHRGDELLDRRAGLAAYARTGAVMGVPLLYPWANRLAAHDYMLDGRERVFRAWTDPDEVAAWYGHGITKLSPQMARRRVWVVPADGPLPDRLRSLRPVLHHRARGRATRRDSRYLPRMRWTLRDHSSGLRGHARSAAGHRPARSRAHAAPAAMSGPLPAKSAPGHGKRVSQRPAHRGVRHSE